MEIRNKTRNIKPKISRSTKRKKEPEKQGKKLEKNQRK
jgi:hypothetical protein